MHINRNVTCEYHQVYCVMVAELSQMLKMMTNLHDLELCIDSLDFRFSIVAVTETWPETHKYDMYNI